MKATVFSLMSEATFQHTCIISLLKILLSIANIKNNRDVFKIRIRLVVHTTIRNFLFRKLFSPVIIRNFFFRWKIMFSGKYKNFVLRLFCSCSTKSFFQTPLELRLFQNGRNM